MTEITVRFLGQVKKAAKTNQIQIKIRKGTTVSDLLTALSENLGKQFSSLVNERRILQNNVTVMVNGENIVVRNGLATSIQEGDVIVILTALAGGSLS